MATRTPRIPDAALARIPGKALYRMATAGAEVVIGGDHPELVLPEAHASKWGGECWLRVRHADADEIDRADKAAKAVGKTLKSDEKASLRTEKGKPVLDIPTPGKGRRHEIREGSLKWDVVYDSPAALPTDGIERFQLEFPAGLTWHYQPPLTAEEVAEGSFRPEEMIGGYVSMWEISGCYLDADGEEIANYETGRFGDIEAPLWVDANGNTLRWTQELVGSELQCPLPTEWLATAVYPVRLDPVFGYESLGASTNSMYGSRIYPSTVGAPTSAGTITAFTMGMTYFNNTTPDVGLCGIYDISSGFPSAPLIGYSQVVASTDPSSATKKWYAFPAVGSPEVVADGVYALCGSVGPDTSLISYQLYDTVTGYTNYYYSRAYDGTLPSPFPGTPSVQGSNRRVSIYATYTESGGGTSLTTIQNLAAYLASTGQTAHNLSVYTATSGVTTTQDLAAALLTDATTRQDLVASIATGMTTAQDLENLVATGITTSHDLRLMLASEIETTQDLLLSVSELVGTVVSQDLLLSVATETTGTQDLATLIATSQTLNHVLRTAVSTAATTAHDLSLQVSELVGTIVRQDLSLSVSTDLAEAQNLAAAITSELATVQDIATRIATGQELTTELAATVATSLSTAQDLALHASAIMEVISRQDLELSVASEITGAQDVAIRLSTEQTTDSLLRLANNTTAQTAQDLLVDITSLVREVIRQGLRLDIATTGAVLQNLLTTISGLIRRLEVVLRTVSITGRVMRSTRVAGSIKFRTGFDTEEVE